MVPYHSINDSKPESLRAGSSLMSIKSSTEIKAEKLAALSS